MSTTSNEKSYFDLHTSGIGYIQRVREVPVRGGRRAQPFLACTIAALVGSARDPATATSMSRSRVPRPRSSVERYIGVDDPKQRPLVRFRLGDLWGDAYIRDKGEHKGQAAASLKARLLKAEPIDRAELASDQAARADHPWHRLPQPSQRRSLPRMAIRSCRAPSPRWLGLSMNRSTAISTRSSPPRMPSIWCGVAYRPSRPRARC